MSTLREAAQQALEALESCGSQHPSDGGRQWYDDKLVEPAIATLRAALAEPVQECGGVMDKRRTVINKAKELAKSGRHFRFFSIDDEIWECYQAEFLPSIGERAWIAEPIRVYIVHDAPSEAQQFGMDLWSGIK